MKGMDMMMAMKAEKPENKMQEVTLPEGFTPPSDVGEGESFDVTVRGYMKNGKFCIESMNGVESGGKEEVTEEVETETPDKEIEFDEAIKTAQRIG